MNKLILLLTLITLALVGCDKSFSYEKTAHSVIITHDSLQTEITIMDEAILHVRKELKESPAKDLPNYLTILDPQGVKWDVSKSKDAITIETSKIKAVVNNKGEVHFYDLKGKALLS